MQKLSKSELRLLALFSGAIFLAANMFALRFWMQERGAMHREISELRTRIAEDKSWVENSANFQDTAAWVAAHHPPELTGDGASVSLVDSVRRGAEAHQLTVAAETLLPSSHEGDFLVASLQIKLTGGFSGVVKLLFELQRSEAWRAIDNLTLRSDSTPPNTVLEFQIRQYHSEPAAPAVSVNP